jgi:hypothetical protein
MSISEILRNINKEDHTVPAIISKEIPQIEALVQAVSDKMLMGGRLFYIGAGTSGRLGIVDASECPPTFGVPYGLVIGIIAGGYKAISEAVEFAEDDTLQGFKAGADDYLTKPFSMDVLVARMEAVLRRTKTDKVIPSLAADISLGEFVYWPQKMKLIRAGIEQKFTPKENDLMKLLCENLGRPVSRSYALKLIWGDDTYFNARSMDVYMTKLRKMLKEDPRVQLLNLHGEGFRLSVEGL